MTNKSYFLILALLLCTMTAWAQYNQVNDIPYREAAEKPRAGASAGMDYARERCKLDVYYPTDIQDAPVVVWFPVIQTSAIVQSHPLSSLFSI